MVLGRNGTILAAVVLAVFLAGAAWGIAVYFGFGGHAIPVQMDALISMQYGRAWAEGRPYCFAAGSAPGTGSTSHLYPAVLGLLYLAGARGDAFPTAIFLFGIACYVGFIYLFGRVCFRLNPRVAPVALGLTLLSGHTLHAGISMNDMSLFMLLAAAAVLAALNRRWGWLGLSLAAASLCRPEGILLSFTCLFWSLIRYRDDEGEKVSGAACAGFAGILAFGFVLGLNKWLTGMWQFHSVVGKGHAVNAPLFGTLYMISRDLGKIVVRFVFGADFGYRSFYMVPIAGGILMLAGGYWSVCQEQRYRRWLHWLLSVFGLTALLVAASGWQGLIWDRYFAWILPFLYFFMAVGLGVFAKCAKSRGKLLIFALPFLIYQMFGMCYMGMAYAEECRKLRSRIEFTKQLRPLIEPCGRVGFLGAVGLSYYLPQSFPINMPGVVTPELVGNGRSSTILNVETLKHEPELRPGVWLVENRYARGGVLTPVCGAKIAEDVTAFEGGRNVACFEADWGVLDAAQSPLSATAKSFVDGGWMLVDTLDVGYAVDEEAADYGTCVRVPGVSIKECMATGSLGGSQLLDVGRVVIGYERFRVKVIPGQALRVVLRTGAKVDTSVAVCDGRRKITGLQLAERPTLRVVVNGEAEDFELRLHTDQAFTEVCFEIPGVNVTSDVLDLTVGGDHVSYAYWFYQEVDAGH
ncbi:MAG: hypothetical protein K9N51_06460 [Candidatus Pacebacteria bacterium]|nr:hypothetical protein [Candidatus Paceibacterota bacterium]